MAVLTRVVGLLADGAMSHVRDAAEVSIDSKISSSVRRALRRARSY